MSTCGCEPLWPSGIDSASCWWHGAGGRGEAARRSEAACDAPDGASGGLAGPA